MSSVQPSAVATAQSAALRSFEAQWLARQSASPRHDPWSTRDPLSALRAEALEILGDARVPPSLEAVQRLARADAVSSESMRRARQQIPSTPPTRLTHGASDNASPPFIW